MNKQTLNVLHWNYRGFTEFPIKCIQDETTDVYLKENLISRIPSDIGKLHNLESLYLSGNDIAELPREIAKLACLKCLDVSGNRLRWVPEEIGELKNLKFLILDENELKWLPLRLSELRSLRYLSVCALENRECVLQNPKKVCNSVLQDQSEERSTDFQLLPVTVREHKIKNNKLQWIAQRPVYNYYHCELRFWRNPTLHTIPYSLWYHMFRGRETRSLNIGSLNIPKTQNAEPKGRCLVRVYGSEYLDINFPPYASTVIINFAPSPPSLLEICRRKLYEIITDAARSKTNAMFSIYSDYNHNYINLENLDNDFSNFNINKSRERCTDSNNKPYSNNKQYGPSDIIQEYYNYLPMFIKNDLRVGPVSKCENICCKKPVFDYLYFEFCLEKIHHTDDAKDVILSATFCSKSCADAWKLGKNILPWILTK